MRYVLAIDEGTTGATCLMIGEDGRVAGRGYREIPQYFPEAGQVEHDALEILDCVKAATRDAVQSAGAEPDVIGITNQRETIVVWERESGRPVHRAIVWQDRRTAERCARLATQADRIAKLTGLVPDPYFSATKLEWLIENERLLQRYTAGDLAAGTIDSWLIWRLTGGAVHATDPTNASRTMLYDIDERAWSPELCDTFGVPAELLPEVRASLGDFGVTRADVLGIEAPIMGVAGDQQAALFGQGCYEPGSGKNTYGTGAFLLLNAGRTRPPAPREFSRRSPATREADRSTRSRRRSSSPARRFSGYATGSASSRAPAKRRPSRNRSTRRAVCTSCRRSPDSVRRIGNRTHAARSSG